MKEKRSEFGASMGVAAALTALAFLLPALCFSGSYEREGPVSSQNPQPAVLPPVPSAAQTPPQPAPAGELDASRRVSVLGADGVVYEPSMEDYLWGVLAAEMPASFELEALKAQSAAARTYTLWKSLHNGQHAGADVCTDPNCCQAWISKEDAQGNWGTAAAENTEKISQAIAATDGQIISWQGEPIQAVFHSSSAGRTEAAVEVWGSTVPYLMGVETPEGEEVPNFHSSVEYTPEELSAALASTGGDFTEDPSTWFQDFTYTNAGAVASVTVGGVPVSGVTLRSLLGLRSATFGVLFSDGVFRFSVTGYGHGVGMSQYGANALARQGKTWEEIVKWYYTGVEITTYDALS